MTIRWPGSRAGETSPSMAFFDLVEACRDAGCPVCRLGREAAADTLDAILYESVNDPGIRDSLRRSWGFCAEHAPMLRQVEHAAGGVAIMYGDFLRRARERLREAAEDAERLAASNSPGGRRRRRAPTAPLAARQGGCLACQAQHGAEDRALTVLLDSFDDPRLREAYAASAGLCLTHLEAAWLAKAGHPRLGALLRDAGERAGRLGAELAEFVRKLDYRFGHEPVSEEEGTAWSRALEWFAGSRPPPETRLARLRRRRRTASGSDGPQR